MRSTGIGHTALNDLARAMSVSSEAASRKVTDNPNMARDPLECDPLILIN